MTKYRKGYLIKGDGRPFLAKKENRNAPCSCGSGKKVKHCTCRKDLTSYYAIKKKEEVKPKTE
jgi:uncharacterized protein YecA (UPF0149 family)